MINIISKLFAGAELFGNEMSLKYWTSRLKRGITQQHRLGELFVFAWLLPIGALLIFPHNPTGLASGFPWIVTGSILFAARYGSAWGVSCALLTGLFLLTPFAAYTSLFSQNLTLALGTLIISLLVGDAASAWRKRSQKSEAENQYLRHRLKEFSTDYHVLKVSHGLLEEYMAGQRLSLREALQQLKPVLSSSKHGIEAGNELMAIFSQFCSIQVAGLYAMNNENRVDTNPIATHGEKFDLPLFDPLLRAAISTHELASIKLESLTENHHSNSLLAVVPLVDTDGHLHGVLAVKDMHFMAFQHHNLNLLALLGYYIGNQLTRSKGVSLSRADWFIAELETVLRFAQTHSTTSALVTFKFTQSDEAVGIAKFITDAIRSLDASWLVNSDDDTQVLCLLLPLMTQTQTMAFSKRIDHAVREQFGISLGKVLHSTRIHQIGHVDSLASCLQFLGDHIGPAHLDNALQSSQDIQEQSGAA